MHGRLTIFFIDRPAMRFHLRDGASYTLGRDAGCDIHVPDRRISRQHARLDCLSGAWRCNDLSSKNGIRVNGRCGSPHELRNGAWLDLGGVFASFETISSNAIRSDDEERQRRRETSAELTRRLNTDADLQALLNDVLESVLQLSDTQRGFVMLTGTNGDFEVAALRHMQPDVLAAGSFSGSLRAVHRAVETAQPVVVCDAAAAHSYANQPSVVAGGIRALITLPLQVSGRVDGVIYADSERPGAVFDELDVDILTEFAARAAVAIAAANVRRNIDAIARMLPAAMAADSQRIASSEAAPLTLGELLRVHAVE